MLSSSDDDTNNDQAAAADIARSPSEILVNILITIKCSYLIFMLSTAIYRIRKKQQGTIKPAQLLIFWMILDVFCVFVYDNFY
jgi:hypothetical protein